MQRYADTLLTNKGVPGIGFDVTVTDSTTGNLAVIYSDNGVTPMDNPFKTDKNGRATFYAANGRYNVAYTADGYPAVYTSDIILNDPKDKYMGDSQLVAGLSDDLASTAAGKGPDLIGDSIRSSSLANTANGYGVDKVANAAKKVASIAALRALRVPQGSDAQTVIVDGEGAFVWTPASTAADDGMLAIDPDSAPASGRWLALPTRAQRTNYSQPSGGDTRMLSAVLADVPNVRNFKKAVDTDDTNSFNTAISYAVANGLGAVIVPPGNYHVSTVNLANRVSLLGIGGKACTNINVSGSVALTGTSSANYGDLVISGISFTNNAAAELINFTYVEKVTFQSCWFYNNDIQLTNHHYVSFFDCEFFTGHLYSRNTAGSLSEAPKFIGGAASGYAFSFTETVDIIFNGMSIIGPSSQISVGKGTAAANTFIPFYLTNTVLDSTDQTPLLLDSIYGTIEGCFISGGRTQSQNGATITNSKELSIIGNSFRYCGAAGLRLDTVINSSVMGNKMMGNKTDGLQVPNCNAIEISGNHCGQDPNWYGGSYAQVSGITDPPGTAKRIICKQNFMIGNSSGSPLYLPDASNIIGDNIIAAA